MKTYKILVLIVLFNLSMCDEEEPVSEVQSDKDFEKVEVKTKQGVVSGKIKRTLQNKQNYYSFRGIPYAEPPVGKLRFKPPVPHQGWEDTLEAYENKPTCLQYNKRSRTMEPPGISGSEDCLYISISTPNLQNNAPVIVFDYNDNFRTGFNGSNTYSPDFFIDEDVIVVTITHRLTIFGYLTTMDDIIPPNNGLKDYILGLNWIKENIKAFGGDPKRVTLMGSRGGAVVADILLHSEKAKDLFSGVIMHSGTALESTFFGRNLRERSFKFGNLFNITSDDSEILLEELQKISAEALIEKEGDIIDMDQIDNSLLSIFPFAPVVENSNDDAVLTSLPENSKLINDVPIMIGMSSREGLDLATHFIFDPRLLSGGSNDIVFVFPVRSNYTFNSTSAIYEEAIKEILTFYFEEGYFYFNNILEYATYIGDLLQNYALNHAAKKLTEKSQSSVYYYMFDFRGSLNENIKIITRYALFSLEPWGATINDELCYLHVCTRIKSQYVELRKLLSEQNEIRVSKKMVRMWTNFAKTGSPTPNEDDSVLQHFKWKPIEKGNDNIDYLHITKNLRMKINPLGKREKFWDEFLAKYSLLAVDGVVQSPEKELHDEL